MSADVDGNGIFVAVVIVTYKTAQLTIDALTSVAAERNLAHFDLRAVVVDNASGDSPLIDEAVGRHGWSGWVTCIKAPKNGGFAYGNNLGIARAFAQGPTSYIHLLNPDAQIRPGGLVTLVRFLEKRPEIGIAGSSFEMLDGTDWPFAFRFPSILSELDAGLEFGPVTRLLRQWTVARTMTKTAQPTDWICGASMLIRPEVFAATGGLDENYFLYFEETDFCRRAKQAGFPTWYVPESRVMHIMGQSTTVTDQTLGPKRLPPYWFDSRRRYFAVTYGTVQASLIDVVTIGAHCLGLLKRFILRRTRSTVPHYITDLLKHSVLWKRNRHFPGISSSLQPPP